MLMSRMYHEAPKEFKFYPETWVLPAEMNDFRYVCLYVFVCVCVCAAVCVCVCVVCVTRAQAAHRLLQFLVIEPIVLGLSCSQIHQRTKSLGYSSRVPQGDPKNKRLKTQPSSFLQGDLVCRDVFSMTVRSPSGF